MMPLRKAFAAVLVALSTSGFCHGQVVTCQDLQDAFELTKTQDVEVTIDYSQEIICDDLTTMSMDSNTLTVTPIEEPCEFCFSSVRLYGVRFEVTNGAKLFWQTGISFFGEGNRDVDGGAVYVGEGSTARFSRDFNTEDVGVGSVAVGDFATYFLTGGVAYVDGYFRVEGDTSMVRCENSGGGESPPGPGGCVYVGPSGSVLFGGSVEMKEVSIIDNEGNDGGGIYNLGKVNIKGNALFEDLGAEYGGAIYNGEGAEFRFKAGATAVFNECRSFDGTGGAVYNKGYFKLSGPALVLNSGTPPFVVTSTGYTRLSEDSVFWGHRSNSLDLEPAILVEAGGRLTGTGSVKFVDGTDTGCATVYYEDGDVCLQ